MPIITKYVRIPGEGDSLTISVKVKNTGDINISNLNIRPLIFQSDQFFIDGRTQMISLNVGESKTLTWTFSPVLLLSSINPSNPTFKIYIMYSFGSSGELSYDTGWIVKIYER